MRIPNSNQYLPGLDGYQPELLYRIGAFDGAAGIYKLAQVGTIVAVRVAAGHVQTWQKAKNDEVHDDWGCISGIISQLVNFDDFTDGGAAVGTLDLDNDIPIGAVFVRSQVRVLTSFATVSTLTLTIGDGTDADRYNTGTPSIATAGYIDMGVPSGTVLHAAAKTPKLTATEDSDWGDITAGQLSVRLHYIY